LNNPKLTSLVIAAALLLAAGMTFREAKTPSYLMSLDTVYDTIVDTETAVEPSNPTQKESCKPTQKQRKPRYPLVASRPMREWDLAMLQAG